MTYRRACLHDILTPAKSAFLRIVLVLYYSNERYAANPRWAFLAGPGEVKVPPDS
jgi:hypothetical protein